MRKEVIILKNGKRGQTDDEQITKSDYISVILEVHSKFRMRFCAFLDHLRGGCTRKGEVAV